MDRKHRLHVFAFRVYQPFYISTGGAIYLWKDGTIHNHTGYDPIANHTKMEIAPGYWPTREEAQLFLDNWPTAFPEEFAEYIAQAVLG